MDPHPDRVAVDPDTTTSDDTYDDDLDADAAAMAAAMGFNSFGAARPAKKRRFNNDATASAAASTGANSLPLHPRGTPASATATAAFSRQAQAAAAKDNADEIDLGDDDDDDASQAGGATIDPANAPARPRTSLVLPAPKQAASNGIDLSLPAPPRFASAPGLADSRQPPASARGSRGGGASGHRVWYIDYYDPSSNENPWERLEQAQGLEPVGSWLPSRSGGGGGRGKLLTV
ncbi:hypothetical protein B0T22DRAFT_443852 [Podospora appendiculata]|uniref:Uncharacterized protein n=1 Tax=Podospora appendiculata TaxID=314037 RepID=A0AAE0X2Y9_9PEZI|nr:hypothetical protein B0T22DRAFT_443852 [Podospora appendiculata]